MSTWAKQKGFTIVELLIVIVVIGILAALVVSTFSGAQDRARRASLEADVARAVKTLKADMAVTGSYPASVAAANGGKGLSASGEATFRYAVNNTADPKTFCITAYSDTIFYSATESREIQEGSCVNVAAASWGATSDASALLLDGVTTTNPYYSKSSGAQAVTVTLPSTERISSIKVWHYYADSRTYHQTKTEVSVDGTNWSTIFDSASSGEYQETSAGKTHSFAPRDVRYIRDWLNGSTSNAGNHWVEIQAY